MGKKSLTGAELFARDLRARLSIDARVSGRFAEIGRIQADFAEVPAFEQAFEAADIATLQTFIWPDPAKDVLLVFAIATAQELRLALCLDPFELYSGFAVLRSYAAGEDAAQRVREAARDRWRPL